MDYVQNKNVSMINEHKRGHCVWTPFYFMYDPKCSTTFPWCAINAPVAFAWCTINVPVAFAWCTNHFVHKMEFSYIGWNGVHPLWCYLWEKEPRDKPNKMLCWRQILANMFRSMAVSWFILVMIPYHILICGRFGARSSVKIKSNRLVGVL